MYIASYAEGGIPSRIGLGRDPDRVLREIQEGCPEELQLMGLASGNVMVLRKLEEALRGRRIWGDWYDVTYRDAALALRETGQLVKDVSGEELTGAALLGTSVGYTGAEPESWNEYGEPVYTEEQNAKLKELRELGVQITKDVCIEEGLPYPRDL